MEKATFKFDSYHFTKAFIDFEIPTKSELSISFSPKGEYNVSKGRYVLIFDVVVKPVDTNKNVVDVTCIASFSFDNRLSIESIPEYFYPNSLAIVFPYVRAFVSTLSLQANVHPIILPTVNLMGLTEQLKKNTIVIE